MAISSKMTVEELRLILRDQPDSRITWITERSVQIEFSYIRHRDIWAYLYSEVLIRPNTYMVLPEDEPIVIISIINPALEGIHMMLLPKISLN